MLNKHIIGELFEIAQDCEKGFFEFYQTGNADNVFSYKLLNVISEKDKLQILCGSTEEYSIKVNKGHYTDYLDPLSKEQALELLYFLKETYDNCKEYPNAFHNALKQMCYKYKKERELKENVKL